MKIKEWKIWGSLRERIQRPYSQYGDMEFVINYVFLFVETIGVGLLSIMLWLIAVMFVMHGMYDYAIGSAMASLPIFLISNALADVLREIKTSRVRP